MYQCSAYGCINPTDGHYCDTHRGECESCGAECDRDELIDGTCTTCLHASAFDDDEYGDGGLGLPVTVDGVRRFG